MSHFSVAVFQDGSRTVEELLAPYQENNMGDCPGQYLRFVSATESSREEYETGEGERVCLEDGSYMYPWDEEGLKEVFTNITYNDGRDHSSFYGKKSEYLLRNSRDPFLGDVQIIFLLGDKGAKLQTLPYKEIYPTLQDYVRDYVEAPWDEEKQDYGYWENPDAKWDWWQKGGRWDKLLKPFHGERCAEARVADIDFEIDQHWYNEKLRWWEVVIEGSPIRRSQGEKESDFSNFYKIEYLLDRYKNKEIFAKVQSSAITDAVLTPDGKWYQRGDMGWFGTNSATAEEAYNWDMRFKETFIDKADPDWILTIVDCHI